MKKTVIIYSGPAASGKTTILNALAQGVMHSQQFTAAEFMDMPHISPHTEVVTIDEVQPEDLSNILATIKGLVSLVGSQQRVLFFLATQTWVLEKQGHYRVLYLGSHAARNTAPAAPGPVTVRTPQEIEERRQQAIRGRQDAVKRFEDTRSRGAARMAADWELVIATLDWVLKTGGQG